MFTLLLVIQFLSVAVFAHGLFKVWFITFCFSACLIVTMPCIYFEAEELTECPWCGCGMIRSIVDVLCIDCSMHFTEHLHPSMLWSSQLTVLPVTNNDDKDFGDSLYEQSGTNTGSTLTSSNVDLVNPCAIGASDMLHGSTVTIYDKLKDCLNNVDTPFLVEEDLWVKLIYAELLSKCWISYIDGNDMVQLALPQFQLLSRYLCAEAPLGLLVFNCSSRTCFHICNLGNIQLCSLRSACHYLRNYPRQSLGFVLAESEKGQVEVAIMQCGLSAECFGDRYRFYIAQAVLDRVTKLLIYNYDSVTFRSV